MKTCLTLFLLILTTVTLQAQTQMYLEIPGIEGESTVNRFEDQIVIDAFVFSAESPKSKVVSGRTRSTVQFSGMNIAKKTDAATNPMLQALTRNQRFDEMVLSLINTSGAQGAAPYLVYTLSNVVISSYDVEGTLEDSKPRESWILEYETLNAVYTKMERDGSAGDTNEFEYKIKTAQN